MIKTVQLGTLNGLKPTWIVLVLLILSGFGCADQQVQKEPKLIDPGKYIQAGIQKFNEQEYEETIEVLSRVNQQYKDPECLKYLVLANALRGDSFEALGYLMEYKKIADQNSYLLLKTEKELILGNLDQAEYDFNRIDKVDVDYRDYLRLKKELFKVLGRTEKAVEITAIEEKYGLE